MENPNEFPIFDAPEDVEFQRPQPLPLSDILEMLINDVPESGILPAGVVYGLSDVKGDMRDELAAAWPTIPVDNRRKTMLFLAEACEDNFDLSYEALAYIGFEDEDADVRTSAVDLLWFDTSEQLFHKMMHLADDIVPQVRAKAIGGLGRFIYAAELEEFDETLSERAKDYAVDRFYDYSEDVEVRRRSVEAVSRGSHPSVTDIITDAYDSPEFLMRVSAVFAMGASCDAERWGRTVLSELDSDYPEMRFEAARAAGELVLEEAVPQLISLAQEQDYDIRMSSIVALGEIGTMEARRGLMNLAESASDSGDDEALEYIEEALELASLMGGLVLPGLDTGLDDLDDDID